MYCVSMTTYWIPSILIDPREIQVRESHASAQLKSWPMLPFLDCKGFGTRTVRETRETKKNNNNEKFSLGMADNCVFLKKKHLHQMRKKNDITKSNEKRNGRKCVTSDVTHCGGGAYYRFKIQVVLAWSRHIYFR